jgi:hypothetical protein
MPVDANPALEEGRVHFNWAGTQKEKPLHDRGFPWAVLGSNQDPQLVEPAPVLTRFRDRCSLLLSLQRIARFRQRRVRARLRGFSAPLVSTR